MRRWLVDGAWRAIPPGEVLSDAAVMREVRFKERFPHVPLLPKKAFHAGKRRFGRGYAAAGS
jgi:hypothetical protein